MKALPKFILLFAVLSILFYWKIFLHPTNFVAGGDNIEYEVMFHQFINSALNQYKEMPLWNPYVFAGSPFSSDIIGGRYFHLKREILQIHRDSTKASLYT